MLKALAIATTAGLAMVTGAMATELHPLQQQLYSVQEGNGPGTGIFGPNDHRIMPVEVRASSYQSPYSVQQGNGPGDGIFGPNDHRIAPVQVSTSRCQDLYSIREGNGPTIGNCPGIFGPNDYQLTPVRRGQR